MQKLVLGLWLTKLQLLSIIFYSFLFVSELPCTLLLEKAMNTPWNALLSKELI